MSKFVGFRWGEAPERTFFAKSHCSNPRAPGSPKYNIFSWKSKEPSFCADKNLNGVKISRISKKTKLQGGLFDHKFMEAVSGPHDPHNRQFCWGAHSWDVPTCRAPLPLTFHFRVGAYLSTKSADPLGVWTVGPHANKLDRRIYE